MKEAAAYAEDFNAKLSEEQENKVLDELKASGVKVVDVTDKAPWKAACKDVIDSNTKDNKELFDKILKMK